jgi:hypothetical protein
VCALIVYALKRPVGENFSWQLGSFEDVTLSTNCAAHRYLISECLRIGGFPRHKESIDWSGVSILGVRSHKTMGLHDLSGSSGMFGPSLELVKTTYCSGFAGRGKISDSRWIDLDILRRWKSCCDLKHGRCSLHNPISSTLPPPRPGWLIDTWRYCLTVAQAGMSYMALSYVWGNVESLKLSKSNLQRFQERDSLFPGKQVPQIPQTITDAMGLVSALHTRYLWVDSLCIVQDDEKTKHDQINNMASIYANASVTIIAEQGKDANFGLRGLRGISQPRKLSQDVFELSGGAKVIYTQGSISDLRGETSLWSKRGWTFQEALFSRRRIIFNHESVRWECGSARWAEDVEEIWSEEIEPDTLTSKFQEIYSCPFPSLYQYGELVKDYFTRQLSNAEDVLLALAGITTSLSYQFEGGFLCGLPVVLFDIALLWRSQGALTRRISSGRSSSKSFLPSWSWAGWHGRLDLWAWVCLDDHIKIPCLHIEQTIPIQQWYSRECLGSEPVPIGNNWNPYKGRFLAFDTTPPQGQYRYRTKLESSTGRRSPCERPMIIIPGREPGIATNSWHPVPVPSRDRAPIIRPLAALISCRTQKASLTMEEILHGRLASANGKCGTLVGFIRLQGEGPIASGEIFGKVACELVAISRGRIRWDVDALHFNQAASLFSDWGNHVNDSFWVEYQNMLGEETGPYYEWYNVLWVEWQGGIAYRKGIGRIAKRAWERQDLEWIDLLLG